MGGLAIIMFIGLFLLGHDMLGWQDPQGQVQLGLFIAFILGIIGGYRSRG